MNASTSFRLVLIVALNFLLDSPANAGVVKRSQRMVREVYPPDVDQDSEGNQPPVCIVGDVVYGVDETVPAEQPCLKCRCQPPGVQCETVQCTKKPGCKAIHRPNRCCPDYQCGENECEHNGHTYANGEKLESSPGGECKVCYCRGGEVQCTEVSCYIRNDCEGKRVPGTCCPKYDHCPPIDFNRSSSTEATPSTSRPVAAEEWPETNASTAALSLEEINKVPVQEVPLKEQSLQHKITIQEIIPERKEIPITAPPKIFISEPQGTLLIEEALPTSEYASNDLGIDSEPESSEVSEVFQHPPPVLRIGDKLLFLKKGNLVPEKDVTTPDSVITIIGAEGLQRGGVEESLEVHELKIEPEFAPIAPDQAAKTPEDLLLQSTDLPKPLGDLNASSDSNDLELRVSESTHILSLVKRKENPANSTTAAPPASTPIEELVNNLTIYKEDVTQSTLIETTTENLTKNTEPVAEQNPAYPPLPDIMPAGGENHQKADLELESSTKQTKIFLSEVNEFLTNQTKNDTHIEWLKTGPNQPNNASLKSFTAASLPEELLVQKSPIDEDMEPNIETTIASIGEVSDLLLPNFEKFEETLVADNQTTELPRNDSWADEGPQLIAEVKILEEPREEEEPLEEDKVQPASIEIKDAEDEPDCPINGTSPRSVESVEMDSGELTTPRTNHSSMVSAEAASVETFQPPTKSSLESVDLIQPASKESGVGLSSLEIIDSTSESILKDVELVDGKGEAPTVQSSSETNIMKHDVELIEVGSTPKPTKVSKIETSTYELLPTPEETQSRSILKRATSSEDEVFKDLEKELNEESSSSKSPEEDQSEAEEIFKQLAKETEQSHEENGPKNPDQEKSERLSKLVADVALKGQFPDINALRHLGLFGSQRK
ncbi:uncharacterized protein LOC109545544 isoform X1 [Dendroctonus ponderosae]|uniref:uncharacterized protein LOC109545544 isoform X1 n=1 Tax=Dendroctonus ponderosae TaxID=77166 RepID=UPI002035F572|nr:uncharacterized protein LOC109545544 isoform X1 [Dendroctonus ponderosae]